jgi:hypothetical protein
MIDVTSNEVTSTQVIMPSSSHSPSFFLPTRFLLRMALPFTQPVPSFSAVGTDA